MAGSFSFGVTCWMELAESHRTFSDFRRLCMAQTADVEADCLDSSMDKIGSAAWAPLLPASHIQHGLCKGARPSMHAAGGGGRSTVQHAGCNMGRRVHQHSVQGRHLVLLHIGSCHRQGCTVLAETLQPRHRTGRRWRPEAHDGRACTF